MKKITSLNIDHEILEKAKRAGFNLSETAENAFKEKLGKQQIEINQEIHNCEFCGREMRKATLEEEGLNWLWPDEKWICPRCLNFKKRGVIARK